MAVREQVLILPIIVMDYVRLLVLTIVTRPAKVTVIDLAACSAHPTAPERVRVQVSLWIVLTVIIPVKALVRVVVVVNAQHLVPITVLMIAIPRVKVLAATAAPIHVLLLVPRAVQMTVRIPARVNAIRVA